MAVFAEGVDYSYGRPSHVELVAAGKAFVVRYGGPGDAAKLLDIGEAQAIMRAGLSIVANAEDQIINSTLAGGRFVGLAWAVSADEHFAKCGMPRDRPIYFSVDFDVREDRWPHVAEALRGAASIIGLRRVGVYGSYRAVTWARRDGVARWFWQTYAWSGGRWAPGNHLEQYSNNQRLAGAAVDFNRALAVDYGQWKVGGTGVWQQGQPWRTVDCIDVALFPQLKAAAPAAVPPATPASSWGTIADDAHNSSSDHYPHYYSALGSTAVVCAGDWPHRPDLGLDNNIVCEAMRQSRDPRIKYVINHGRIFSSYSTSSRPAWTWGPYTGSSDPHDTHAHLSTVATAIADSTAPWAIGIGEPEMDEAHAALLRAMGEDWSPNKTEYLAAGGVQATWDAMANAGMVGGDGRINKDGSNVKKLVADLGALKSKVDTMATDLADLKARPPVEATPVDAATLATALQDPAVADVLGEAMFQAAQRAESE